ncbi:conjugative relaxase domain-containing protein, TrwC/TraI family [Variovorax sp. HW608]|nr:MobF family relaxase [Variovorax sp. HW608]SCK09125.1 conjugative relaxase domain-containing protein, TrwC/TraI family [Variovorax sp. HW608]
MLSLTLIKGNNQYAAAHYFSSADDYYTKENPGEWQGAGAQALGLTGPIEHKQLARLLDGQLPNGERIQATFNSVENKKRMGLDLTFSPPKSVSMQALVAGDKGVTQAHDHAVTSALEFAETLAAARRKVKGKSYRERTGNMVIGKFRHEMSRAKDPQLHTHAVILNMTQRSDGAWRSLSNEEIFALRTQVEAHYHAELAAGLQELGYVIRLVDDKGVFELAHISREQIEAFSQRSMVIEEALANGGKTRATATTLEKQVIALATRERKDESDREVIKQYWVEKSREFGIDYGPRSQLGGWPVPADRAPGGPARPAPHRPETDSPVDHDAAPSDDPSLVPSDRGPSPSSPHTIAPSTQTPPVRPSSLTPAQAVVQYAIKHLTEREAIVTEHDLTTVALQRAVGLVRSDEIRAEIQRLARTGALIESMATYAIAGDRNSSTLSSAGWKRYLMALKGWDKAQAQSYLRNAIVQGSLVRTAARHTTTKALKLERAILAIERAGRGSVVPIVAPQLLEAALAGSTLNTDQQKAVHTIVATNNRFVGIQGDAGTGKSFTVARAADLIHAAGYRTLALAPYGNQVKALKQEGLKAHTLASFLKTKNRPIDSRTLVVLDEAGTVGARQMQQLMRIVEKTGARMVLLGDTKQTEAIEAGNAIPPFVPVTVTTYSVFVFSGASGRTKPWLG